MVVVNRRCIDADCNQVVRKKHNTACGLMVSSSKETAPKTGRVIGCRCISFRVFLINFNASLPPLTLP